MVRFTSARNRLDDCDSVSESECFSCFRSTSEDTSIIDNTDEQPQSPQSAKRNSSSLTNKRRLLDVIFQLHALWACITGALAVGYPQIFEVFMNLGETPGCTRLTEQAHTIIQLYGALILAQSWLVWQTRRVPDPFVRKIFVQGYLLCFGLSSLVLGYKQVFSSQWARCNWPIIGLFASFTALYAWFLATKRTFDYDLDSVARA